MTPRLQNRRRVAAIGRLLQRMIGSETKTPLRTLRPHRCWWCDGPADSREHRYKKTDLVREHGKGAYSGDATPGRIGVDGRREARSAKSDVFKFEPSMCQNCNNMRSQPVDRAYDAFVDHLWANEPAVLVNRSVDLKRIWGEQWPEQGRHALRYFVKHACCRVAELATREQPTFLPLELISFMDGGAPPPSLSLQLTIEPVQVTMEARHRDDPLWTRWLGIDDLLTRPGDECSYESRSRYGWLTCSWRIDTRRSDSHAFVERILALPVVATQFDITFEFAMVAAPDGGEVNDELADTGSDAGAYASPASDVPTHELRTNRAFMGGVLDFDYAIDHRAPPDERLNMYDNLPETVDEAAELRRAKELISGTEGWLVGDFGHEAVAAHNAAPAPFDPDHLKARSEAIQATVAGPPPLDEAKHFASVSALKLAEAAELGIETEAGQDCALEAAHYAGACLALAAHLYGQRPHAYARALG